MFMRQLIKEEFDSINLAKGAMKFSTIDTELQKAYRIFDQDRHTLDPESHGFMKYLKRTKSDLYKSGQ